MCNEQLLILSNWVSLIPTSIIAIFSVVTFILALKINKSNQQTNKRFNKLLKYLTYATLIGGREGSPDDIVNDFKRTKGQMEKTDPKFD